MTPTDAILIALRGRKVAGPGKTSVPPEKCGKEARAFAEAGTALMKMLKTKKSAELAFVDGETIAKLLPKGLEADLKKAIEKSKSEADEIRENFNDLEYDEMKIELDEVLIIPLGADGLKKEGLILGKLKFTGAGDVTFRLNRYETK